MHTASGLFNANHREPSVTYEMLHKLTWLMTRDVTEVQKMCRRIVFNVLTRNHADHVKNHASLMGGGRAMAAFTGLRSDLFLRPWW